MQSSDPGSASASSPVEADGSRILHVRGQRVVKRGLIDKDTKRGIYRGGEAQELMIAGHRFRERSTVIFSTGGSHGSLEEENGQRRGYGNLAKQQDRLASRVNQNADG